MADVFISYKRVERQGVEQIADLLRQRDLSVWFDAHIEAGRQEGFDAEIEREVTSASCVVVCWTPEALKSVYVKAEAKKGLERDALVPVMLQPCTLPVPFNGVDTIDLTGWHGAADDPRWERALSTVIRRVERAKRDEAQRRAQSRAEYERLDAPIYPGTLAFLAQRIAAISEWDARDYRDDVASVLSWLSAIANKEREYHVYGYDLADRQSGGNAWMFWDRGGAVQRRDQVRELRRQLAAIDATLAASEELLNRPAP